MKVFGLSESQIARRVKVIAKAAGLADWEFSSGHSGRVGMPRRMAQNGAPTHEGEYNCLRLDRIHQNRYPV